MSDCQAPVRHCQCFYCVRRRQSIPALQLSSPLPHQTPHFIRYMIQDSLPISIPPTAMCSQLFDYPCRIFANIKSTDLPEHMLCSLPGSYAVFSFRRPKPTFFLSRPQGPALYRLGNICTAIYLLGRSETIGLLACLLFFPSHGHPVLRTSPFCFPPCTG